VLLDYVTDSGRTVVHLSPSDRTPARFDRGVEVKLGPRADGVIGTVGAPYGTDLILVTVSGQPLGVRDRPPTEPAEPYLRTLIEAVTSRLREGRLVAADATALETVAR
jgi:hypothetical protein